MVYNAGVLSFRKSKVLNKKGLSMQVDRSIVSISSVFDDTESRDYWLTQGPQKRVRHIEELRRVNYGNRATERLQRFFEIA